MTTIKDYLEFWDEDLIKIDLKKDIKNLLTPPTVFFLSQYGFPSATRIYKERKAFLEQTAVLPDIFLNPRIIDRNIKRQHPYFEFLKKISVKLIFEEQEFFRIGMEADRDIVIKPYSGNIHYIDYTSYADLWHDESPPPFAQNLFLNSDVEKLGLCLTAEFLARQKSIFSRKKIVSAVELNNTALHREAADEIKQITNALESELKAIDPLVFEISDSYWVYYFLTARYPDG